MNNSRKKREASLTGLDVADSFPAHPADLLLISLTVKKDEG